MSTTVNNSHFENGTASGGGGLAIWSTYKAFPSVQSGHLDTINTGNHADKDRGGTII